MKNYKIKIIFFSFLLLVSALGGVFFGFSVLAAQPGASYVAGEFLVKFKNDPEIYKFRISEGSDVYSVIKKYQGSAEIEFLEPNYKVKAAAFPNDPDYGLQWYLKPINAADFWSKDLLVREQGRTVKQTVIAVLDTGVYLDHPDLKDKIWINKDEVKGNNSDDDKNNYIDDFSGWNFVENNNNPNPSFSGAYDVDAAKHGTIVSGIAAAATNNQMGIAGVSWFAQIMPLRVLDSTGAGDVYSVVQAIDYAVDNGADVINMSFVGNGFSQSLFNAIKRAYDNNIIVVAAAGNTNPALNGVDLDVTKSYPVCYDGAVNENMVIGVASVGADFKKSNFSSYGGCVDIVAPGESFYSTQVYRPGVAGFDKYYNGYWSGTSLSTPLVSGVAATIKALQPGFSADKIRNFILDSAKDVSGFNPNYKNKLGKGFLDAAKALDLALSQKLPADRGGEGNLIIAGLGFKSFPQLKVLKTDGSVFKAFYPYDPNFSGGINVAACDVNGDNKSEIITSPTGNGGPHIRIFNLEGQLVSQFFAYDKNFRGGVNIACGDINNDGKGEIIAGPGKGGKPEVKVFAYQGKIISKFFAYGENFLGGVKVAVGDIDGNGLADIITGAGAGGGPHVRVFRADGLIISQFFAFNQNFKGGVNVAAGDLQGDNNPEIIVSIEKEAMPEIRIFTYNGVMLSSFFAFEPNFLKGVYVATGDIDNDGLDEIVAGTGIGEQPMIKVFNNVGRLKAEIKIDQPNYKGGARVSVMKY
ncbi:MAG: S8 family peptidase [Patescibacteria group bacterium]|jgi:subtilisin family serine protease